MMTTFEDIYQDTESLVSLSPQMSIYNSNQNDAEEDSSYSHPFDVKQRNPSGKIGINTRKLVSQSTVSASSLIQRKDRIAVLPRNKYGKVPVSMCVQPALFNVKELSEQDDRSTNTTDKFTAGYASFRTRDQKTSTEIKSKSGFQPLRRRSRRGRRKLPAVDYDDNATSLLLVATVGSNNDSVLNETIEQLAKSKDFTGYNIVELLVQEALQAQPMSRELSDSDINTDDKKSQDKIQAIKDTSNEIKGTGIRAPFMKNCAIVSKSITDDESNTKAINEFPYFVDPRQSSNKPKPIVEVEKQKAFEKLFSEHAAENRKREIAISPSLARKLNETSSETSLNFDELMNENINTIVEQAIISDTEINEFLNDMGDKACSDFDKCNENEPGINEMFQDIGSDIFEDKKVQTLKPKPSKIPRQMRNIKLSHKSVNKAKTLSINKTKNVEKSTKKMSTINEQKEEKKNIEEKNPKIDIEIVNVVKIQSPKKKTENTNAKKTEALLERRKRNPPKDVEKIHQLTVTEKSEKHRRIVLSEIKNHNSNKTLAATCSKDIERGRKKKTTWPRSRNLKFKSKAIEMPPPRSLKMNKLFNNLKPTVENNVNITVTHKNTDVYNFTSESEDDDFVKKKIEMKKRISSINARSSKTTLQKTKKRGANESESSYDEVKKATTVKRKKLTKRMSNSKVPGVHIVDLVDERIREHVREELDSSILIENPINIESIENGPVLQEIHDIVLNDTLASNKSPKKTLLEQTHDSESNDTLAPKKKVDKTSKNTKLLLISAEEDEDETRRTDGHPPGLVAESMSKYREDVNDSTTNSLQKFERTNLEGVVNTQNMLIDADRFNSSAHNRINIANEIYYGNNKDIKDAKSEKGKKAAQSKTNKNSGGKKAQQQVVEIIEILDTEDNHELNDNQLDKSIATNGITAHADFDEAPPAPETINDHFLPRELQDMDLSMQDYFTELTRAIHNSTFKDRESSKSVEGEEVCKIFRSETEKIKSPKASISPILSVKQRSFKDITNLIPSLTTSDSEGSQFCSQKTQSRIKQVHDTSRNVRSQTKVNVINDGTTPKSVAPNKNTKPSIKSTPESIKLKSPIVATEIMYLEELNRWLPIPKSFDYGKNVTLIQREGSSCDLKLVNGTRNLIEEETLSKQNEKAGIKTKPGKETTKPIHIDSHGTASHNTKSRSIHMRKDDILLHKQQQKNESDSDSLDSRTKAKFNTITSIKNSKSHKEVMTLKTATLKKREITEGSHTDSDEPNKTRKTSNVKYAKKPKTRYMSIVDSTKESTTTKKKPIGKKMISPIVLTKSFASNTETDRVDSTKESTTTKKKPIGKKMISPIVLIKRFASNTETDSSDDNKCVKQKERNFTKSKDTKDCSLKSIKIVESANIKSPVHLLKRKSTSTIKSVQSNIKRRFYEPKRTDDHKISIDEPKWKVDVLEGVSVYQSGPTTSSVDDWAGTTGQRDTDVSTQYADALHYILEKLDSTLAESNKNTSIKFINVFMEMQKCLNNHLEEIRSQIKQDRAIVLDEFHKIVKMNDEMNSNLNKKLSLHIYGFMDKMKEQTLDFIRNDSNHKKAVLKLLKEDVQTIIDQQNK